jgi:phage-related protein
MPSSVVFLSSGVSLVLFQKWYTCEMSDDVRFKVLFYQTASEREPVREWLKSLPDADRKLVGEDIKTVQFGFPLGMPLVRKLEGGLWEVRSQLRDRIARVIFTIEGDFIVLLHGFIKKTQKTPLDDLEVARTRAAKLRGTL